MHKILIVDDERPARDLLFELVSFYIPDSKITSVDNAAKALECFHTDNYDLLFADISMPGMTGLELLEEINRSGKQPQAFIITAHRQYEFAVKGFRLGILDYIEKPLHKEKIYEAAKLYLSKVNTGALDLKVYDGVRRIDFDNLLAIETTNRRKLKVYTSDCILPEVTSSLTQLCNCLPSNFRYISRDCIINLFEIKRYNLKTREVFIVCQNKEVAFVASRNGMKDLLVSLNFSNPTKNGA